MAQSYVPEQTPEELVFSTIVKKLPETKNATWEIYVRFKSINSSVLSQIFSLLIGKGIFRFSDQFPNNPNQAILFTDDFSESDRYKTRSFVLANSTKDSIEVEHGDIVEEVKVENSTGKSSYLFVVWDLKKIDHDRKQVDESHNISSQLTRPDIFPPGPPLYRVSFTSEGQYSKTLLRVNNAMVEDILSRFKDSINLLDGTANCGADTINTAYYAHKQGRQVKQVAVELDPLNYTALVANVKLYGMEDQVQTVNANVVSWLEESGRLSTFDVLYFDPPWGGRNYKSETNIRLELSGINIFELCRRIIADKSESYYKMLQLMVVKAPFNMDRSDPALLALGQAVQIKTYPVARNIVYIFITLPNISSSEIAPRMTRSEPEKPIRLPNVVCVKVSDIRPKYATLREWMADPENVYIGRGGIVFIDKKRFPPKDSSLANPYKVPQDGTIDEVLDKYREHLTNLINKGTITREYLCSLSGKTLGCWCKGKDTPHAPCHGDVVVEFFKKYCS